MAEKKPVQQAVPTEAETDAHVDDLVNKALKALEEFEDFTQEQVDYIVAKCSVAGLDHHGILAEAAVKQDVEYLKIKLLKTYLHVNMLLTIYVI